METLNTFVSQDRWLRLGSSGTEFENQGLRSKGGGRERGPGEVKGFLKFLLVLLIFDYKFSGSSAELPWAFGEVLGQGDHGQRFLKSRPQVRLCPQHGVDFTQGPALAALSSPGAPSPLLLSSPPGRGSHCLLGKPRPLLIGPLAGLVCEAKLARFSSET